MADAKSAADEVKPDEIVSNTIEQRKSSQRYFNDNYYAEWAEIYRNLNARAEPIMTTNPKTGDKVEDSSKTNVCTPDHFVMQRRGVARLTRNPPNLRVRGGPDTDEGQMSRDKVSAKLMFNWDRSEAQRAFKKIVSVTYGLGWGVGKVYYDEVPIVRRLRRLTQTLQPKDFDKLANDNDPQVAQLVKQFGERLKDPKPFSEQEMGTIMAAVGDEVSLKQSTIKYKGPVLDSVFVGDIYPEPGFRSLPESAYVIENSMRDKEWLEYWKKQTSINPVTGEKKPVLIPEACDEVLDLGGNRAYLDTQEMTLRRFMRNAIEIADPITAGKPIKAPRKRFMLDERHTIVDGHLCVDFVGEQSVYLGRLWYPWDTYGRYQYSEMVMIPDWLGGIGMSTLRVTRFLMMLRNARLNQTTDFINNKLLPLMKGRENTDLTAYDITRTAFARLVQVANMGDLEFQQDPVFPAEAWSDQAQLQQQMQQADPSTIDFAPGNSDVASAGKFATTARLADKQADNVTADNLDNINMFVRDVVELELWMDQQAMNDPVDVPREYFDRAGAEWMDQQAPEPEGVEALSIRTSGANARSIKVDWPDMQEDFEILPEAGSTLASDDEFRVRGLQQFYVIAKENPGVVNIRTVIKKLAAATPGINPEDILLPEAPPTPQEPPVKMGINIAVKWPELATDVQAAMLEKEGLPSEMTHALGVGQVIGKMSEAADAASNLEAPVDHSQPQQNGKPKPKPNGKPA